MHDAFTKFNSTFIDELIKKPKFTRRLDIEISNKNVSENSKIVQSLFKEMQNEYIIKHPPLDMVKKMGNAKREVILNKGKNVYITKNSEIHK